jgi:hypothetical protein
MRCPSGASGTRWPFARQLDLFHASDDIIRRSPAEAGSIGFTSAKLILASLPHKKYAGGVYVRKAGRYQLKIVTDPAVGIPYGRVPRIILFWIVSEAVRTQSPWIELGKCQADFLKRRLGIGDTGGDRGSIPRYRDQAQRLFCGMFSVTEIRDESMDFRNVTLAESGRLLWTPHMRSSGRFEGTLKLSDTFFTECIDHGFPIDVRAVSALSSTIAIDLYTFFAYRLRQLRAPLFLTWEMLHSQLGSQADIGTPSHLRSFKAKLSGHLRRVFLVYPDARVEVEDKGLWLRPSRPPVPERTRCSGNVPVR